MPIEDNFRGKRVIVTGHTGFKGAWLSLWLTSMEANVLGIGLEPLTNPSLYSALNLEKYLDSRILDIRNADQINAVFQEFQPDFVFHLAAQALVSLSFEYPIETWETNVSGTLSVLNALRNLRHRCNAVLITSDKCYENVEWVWGYRETDRLGGIDPYSASKAAAEIAIGSYARSFFQSGKENINIGSARAGNVIGGGDWSRDRIVPDCIRAWSDSSEVVIRNPLSTRPWQHVLEPLSGYLAQVIHLSKNCQLNGEAFNFGPNPQEHKSVSALVEAMSKHWGCASWEAISEAGSQSNHEAGLLKLNCDKSLSVLSWKASMNFEQTVGMTVDWYKSYNETPSNALELTLNQIKTYTSIAKSAGLLWTN